MATSILELLKRDHRKVDAILAAIESAGSDEQREQLFAQLVGEIEIHAQSEEDVFYDTLDADAQLEERLDDARHEHDEIDHLLEEMDEIGSAGAEWIGKLRDLRQLIQHHVDDEENRIFPRAQEVLGDDQLARLGGEFEHARRVVAGAVSGEMKALGDLTPTAPLASHAERDDLERLGKKELYELARQRDIDGRSTMTRTQLLQAIRSAR